MNRELINPLIASIITFAVSASITVLFSLGNSLSLQLFAIAGGFAALIAVWKKDPFPFKSILGNVFMPNVFSKKGNALKLKIKMIRCKENVFKKLSICIVLVFVFYIILSQLLMKAPVIKQSEPLIVYFLIHVVFVFTFSFLATVSFCDSSFIILTMREAR